MRLHRDAHGAQAVRPAPGSLEDSRELVARVTPRGHSSALRLRPLERDAPKRGFNLTEVNHVEVATSTVRDTPLAQGPAPQLLPQTGQTLWHLTTKR